MRIASIAAVIGFALLAMPVRAQTPPPPTQQPPPQTQAAQQPPAQPAPPPAAPFPAGAKVAVINVQRVAAESTEGKSANSKAQALNQKMVAELNEKNKVLQAAQQKLSAGGTPLTGDARAQIQKEIDRLNVEIQRFTQDAQAEVDELQTRLQNDFQRKLMPIIELVAVDKGIQIIFAHDSVVWFDPGLDITTEVIRRFDGAMGAGPPKPPDAVPFPPDQRQSR